MLTPYHITLICWLLLWVFSGFISFAVAVTCLCLKDRPRRIAIDVLLYSSTLTVLLSLAPAVFPKPEDAPKGIKSAIKSAKESKSGKSNNLSRTLQEYSFLDRIAEPAKSLNKLDGTISMAAALKDSEEYLRAQVKLNPLDEDLYVQLAIIKHEQQGDFKETLRRAIKIGLLRQAAKIGSEAGLSEGLLDVYNGSKLTQPEIEELNNLITQQLPDGWFRDTALKSLLPYRAPSEKALFEKSSEAHFQSWSTRYGLFLCLRSVICAFGLVSIFYFFKQKDTTKLPEPRQFGFRKVYGCALTLMSAQIIISIIVAIYIAITAGYEAVVESSKLTGKYGLTMLASVMVGNLISISASVYFFICKPQQIHFWKSIWCRPEDIPARNAAVWIPMTFCSVSLLGWLIRTIQVRLPGQENHAGNQVFQQIVESVSSQNALYITLTIIVACVIAPLTEEILFRGLIYPWLRHRINVAAGVLISASLFAAWHMDLHGLVQYVAIGAVLAIVYEKTRSLTIVASVHALWNAWIIFSIALLRFQ